MWLRVYPRQGASAATFGGCKLDPSDFERQQALCYCYVQKTTGSRLLQRAPPLSKITSPHHEPGDFAGASC